MNSGIVSSRYAKALLQFARDKGTEEKVYADAQKMLEVFKDSEALKRCIDSSCAEFKSLLELVIRNKRVNYLQDILHSTVSQYRREHKITTAHLVSTEDDPILVEKVRTLLAEYGYTQLEFDCDVNPELLGGFVLQVNDKRLDASLIRELKTIRKEFEDKNKRII